MDEYKAHLSSRFLDGLDSETDDDGTFSYDAMLIKEGGDYRSVRERVSRRMMAFRRKREAESDGLVG